MATEKRRVIWRHPKGIYETVEVSGTGVFGEPYRYTETVRTPKRDERRMVNPKEDAKARCEARRNASATPEEKQKIVELYEAGNSILAIAREQGRAYAVVSAILHASGVKMRSPGKQKKKG